MLKFAAPLIVLAACAVQAQTLKLPASLDNLAPKAKEVVDIKLDGSLLSFAAKSHDGKQTKNNIKVTNEGQLKGGFIRSYEFEEPGQYSQADVDAVAAQLHEPGWSCVINVHSKKRGENTQICFHSTNGQRDGMALIAAEPKELTILSLVGVGDLSEIGKLVENFDLPDIALGMKPEK